MLRRCEACGEWTGPPFVEVYPDPARERASVHDGRPLSVCASCVVGRCVPAFRPSRLGWSFGRVVAYSHPFFAVFFDDAVRPEWVELDPRPMESYLKVRSPAVRAADGNRRSPRETPSPPHYYYQQRRTNQNPFAWWTRAPPVSPYEPEWHSPYNRGSGGRAPAPVALETRERSLGHLGDADAGRRRQRRDESGSAPPPLEGTPTRENSPGAANKLLAHKSSPRLWTAEEDRMLVRAVQLIQGGMVPFQVSTIKWPDVAKLVPHRTGKQCRERYFNHLASTVSTAKAWTPVEDATVCRLYGQVGSRWAFISKFLPGRSDNNVKNRFHYLRRQLDKQEAATPSPDEPDRAGPGAVPDVLRRLDRIRASVDASVRSNDGLAGAVTDLLARALGTGHRLLSPRDLYEGFFGPFVIPRSPEACARCGLAVPSAQTGSQLCSKTRWCVACSTTAVFVSGAALRLEHQLRSSAGAPTAPDIR